MKQEKMQLLEGEGGIFTRALDFAAMKHEGKYRKNPEARVPYIVHPVKVAIMLMEAGFDKEVVAAGLLHDTVEDSDATIEGLREEFGDRIAGFVDAVTEPGKDMSWKVRQEAYLRKVEAAGGAVLAISACDKIDNMRSMLQSLKAGYNIFENLNAPVKDQLAKFERLLRGYEGKVPMPVERLFVATLQELGAAAGGFQ